MNINVILAATVPVCLGLFFLIYANRCRKEESNDSN